MNRVGDNLICFGANEALVSALLHAGVRFVVIGGLAVAWHCPSRRADDLDLLVEPTPENSIRIVEALGQCGLSGLQADTFAGPGRQVALKKNLYADLLTPEVGGLPFLEVEAASVKASLFGKPVLLASVASLLQMKRRAAESAECQRMKHEKDITLLESLSSV